MENWITGLIAAAGLSLVTYLVESGVRIIRAELKKKKAEAAAAERQVLSVAFEGADRILETVTRATVGKLEGSVAADLREKVKAGEAGYDDLCRVSETACREIIDQIKPELQTVLLECIGDLETHVRNRIETVLPGIKAEYAQAAATKRIAGRMAGGDRTDETVGMRAQD